MNSLPLFQIESDLLDTMEVASNYGVGKRAITQHFSRNQDELIEGVHYHLETSQQFKTKVIKWTLEGVYMLGFFVKKSKVAKEYRSKVAKAIAQAREKQLAEAKETKARNVELARKYADLEAYAKFEAKRHGDQINGYKSQISRHNAVIVKLKTELAKRGKIYDAEVIERYEQKEENLRAMLHNAKAERDFYFKRTQELKQKQNVKDSEIVRILNKIQIQMDGVYSEIGAVMAYANDNDRFFIERNQILKG
ncbi:hypothetical protein [Campylobacter concisus]|uniref:Uncharacterized protein n=1 Tax=Campylobacter concisus ATCC 51562 TaxID=1242969 RepID=U2F6G4_9BACT|nr:hypothetical protein [Campylobacter concisus]ERJ25862.1 hypothetical protein ATCC51562_1601 [Campylobacter concisus ATCC 51562]